MSLRLTGVTGKVSLGIGAKMALLLCSVVAFATIGGGVWTYLRFSQRLVQEEFSRQSLAASSIESEILGTIRDLREDVASLATLPSVTGLLRARRAGGMDPVSRKTEGQSRKDLESHFQALLADRADYSQVRLIGATDSGREIVRVERQGDQLEVAPRDRLQQKDDRPYFQATIKLLPGQLYVSSLELNEEHGQLVIPHVPVVRVAIPVYTASEAPEAILVINTDLRRMLYRFRRALAGRYSLYVFDREGRFLLHPDPRLQFAPQLGTRTRVTDEFPGLILAAGRTSLQRVVERAPGGRKVVADLRGLGRDADPTHDWGLLVTGDYAAATAVQTSLRTQIVAWGSILMALTLGTVMVFSRSLTRPLRQITRAVEQFGHGDAELELPLGARDEAGVLARAFDEAARKIREQDAAMKREVDVRRRAEDALREAERQLRLALDAAQAGVWVWDLESRSTYRDEIAAGILGLPPGTGGARRWTERLHPADRPAVEEKLRLATTEKQLMFDSEFRLSDGASSWKHVKARAISVLGTGGKTVKLIGVCWDVTDEKAVQRRITRYAAELKAKNDELEQFVYSVSHDLKSPLVTCKGYLGLMREDLEDGRIDQALDCARRLDKAADYMKCLIEDLLELSRAGGIRAAEKPVDVAGLVRAVVEQCQSEARAVHVDVGVAADTPKIVADPSALARLFQNLIGNAFKYACDGPNPRVEIGGVENEEETWFYVRDFGPGIDAEYHEKIFGLFQRLETSHEGTGIGLAIVKKIVDGYGGRVWVESGVGKGTTFWVSLPKRTSEDTVRSLEEVLV